MHPAKSVIFFTTASGAGYGLLFLLITGNILSILPVSFWFLFVNYGLAFALIVAGLLSSTFHLGHPERAWRALTQWRSSWLSREGVMALLTFIPTGLFALHVIFFSEVSISIMPLVGVLGLIACAVTVYCTAMIYASLKPVHAWHNNFVPYGYLLLSLTTGSVLLSGMLMLWGYRDGLVSGLAIILLAVALIWKLAYWRFIDQTKSISSPESATGLGEFGAVSLLEGPHTEANYLMQEMGFRVARKHAEKLRKIVIVLGLILPAILITPASLVGDVSAAVLSIVAILSMGIGILTERWLFFAEAKHTVGLYYGAKDA
jgi:DMSO reductase anchor subunit